MIKPVISTWGCGPTFRRRVRSTILEAVNSGYDNIMKYVVLTDYPPDFDDLVAAGHVIAVLDINKERDFYAPGWSREFEYIPPSATDEVAYANEYKQGLSEWRFFNYSLHRFSLPYFAKNGHTKFVFMDADVKIKYDQIGKNFTEEEFWTEFDTPVNHLKGVFPETVSFAPQEDGTIRLNVSMGAGSCASSHALQVATVLLYEAHRKASATISAPVVSRLVITEGPFKYYHFESGEKLQAYFDTWNDNIRICLSSFEFRNTQMCGGYMLCDYIPIAAANLYHNIQVLPFPNRIYQRQIYYQDRTFIPPMAAGLSKNFIATDTEAEFHEVNKELIEELKTRKGWPHVEPY